MKKRIPSHEEQTSTFSFEVDAPSKNTIKRISRMFILIPVNLDITVSENQKYCMVRVS
jgi:hypothetical protein